jgi:hypothetical protein
VAVVVGEFRERVVVALMQQDELAMLDDLVDEVVNLGECQSPVL